jgi:hypothetical protein
MRDPPKMWPVRKTFVEECMRCAQHGWCCEDGPAPSLWYTPRPTLEANWNVYTDMCTPSWLGPGSTATSFRRLSGSEGGAKRP